MRKLLLGFIFITSTSMCGVGDELRHSILGEKLSNSHEENIKQASSGIAISSTLYSIGYVLCKIPNPIAQIAGSALKMVSAPILYSMRTFD